MVDPFVKRKVKQKGEEEEEKTNNQTNVDDIFIFSLGAQHRVLNSIIFNYTGKTIVFKVY